MAAGFSLFGPGGLGSLGCQFAPVFAFSESIRRIIDRLPTRPDCRCAPSSLRFRFVAFQVRRGSRIRESWPGIGFSSVLACQWALNGMTRFGYHQKCRFATSSIDGFPALRMKDFMAKERNRKKTQSQQRTLTPSSANEKLDPGSRRPTSNRLFLWFIFVGSLVGSMAVMTYLRLPPATAPVYTYQVL